MALESEAATLALHHERTLQAGIADALGWLERHQDPRGFWVGALETNPSMEAEWILAMHFLGVRDDPKYPGVVRAILNDQRADGSWENYYEAPAGDISTTVECYAALRVAGFDPDSPQLRAAREWIMAQGGLARVRVFTKFWLALIGEWPWDGTPSLPPELIFLPSWVPFNIYQFSSWARGTMVPLSILAARRPVRPLAPEQRLDELFPDGRANFDYSLPRRGRLLSWERLFYWLDRGACLFQKLPWHPRREEAIKVGLEWIIERQEADGCWGGIQPPWVYSLMALHVEGYAIDHPVVAKGLDAFNAPWAYERRGGTYVQACVSPVWDTVLALLAYTDCGCDGRHSKAVRRAIRWVLDEQVRVPGDWQVYAGAIPAGGWAFEFENDTYPDVDDTAVALIALARLRDSAPVPAEVDAAIERGAAWVLGMRCRNGAWAAFDKDNTNPLVAKIPFCDFGEALDPPSVDVTAHVVEALGALGRDLSDPVVARAVAYIRAEQERDGSWFGRWGVNHIYGTAAVLPALAAVGEDMHSFYVRRAADWISEHQNPDGGWGETCGSYMDLRLRGVGDSTASQTAWALMALLAVGAPRYAAAIRRGVEYLLRTITSDGTWDEPQYTGTGFPGYGGGARVDLSKPGSTLPQGTELGRGFMINYNLYRHYFPVMALGRARDWCEAQAGRGEAAD
ncbi:MAG: squalene--hopene cyclase [Fimbriimonadaceae bacterium]|nr:squalene--hopene cyclase [Fimbriimonadaceae bacterium]